jgi:stage V sporulation protein SpoVS
MSRLSALAPLALLAIAAPALARQDSVVTDREPSARDVAETPLTDLNLASDPIPAILVQASAAPYDREGLATCKGLRAAIADLDAVLGPDMDVATAERDRISPGRMATSVIGSFIPFRGIIREISGAAEHQRDFQAAIVAGAVRRGYLKGLGEQMGCPYPARPAFTRVAIADAERTRGEPVDVAMPAPSAQAEVEGTTFVSQPVVQELKPRARTRHHRRRR